MVSWVVQLGAPRTWTTPLVLAVLRVWRLKTKLRMERDHANAGAT